MVSAQGDRLVYLVSLVERNQRNQKDQMDKVPATRREMGRGVCSFRPVQAEVQGHAMTPRGVAEVLPRGCLSSFVLVVLSGDIPNELTPGGFARCFSERRSGSVGQSPFFMEARWPMFW